MNITDITPVKKASEKSVRLAAYCRVSSDSKDQLHSFAAQIRYYTEYTRKNPQYTLVDLYADEGLTGTCMDKRDEMNRMLRDCKKGLIDRIVVKSVSRFARNTEELLVALRMLTKLGISVYFEEQGIDSSKMNMEMIVTFPGMAAQQESISISQNMRWSCKKRMESGEFNCSYTALGFIRSNGKLIVNEKEAWIVRKIFDLYLQGYGKQTIANMLNAENIPCKKGESRWHHSAVNYILNNERYMGDALLQKKYTTETIPFKTKTNHGELPQYYVENSNPPIVSRETYMAAQKLQTERKLPSCKRKRYSLTGMLRCPECGRAFRRQMTSGVVYWICSGKSSGATNCQSRRIREDSVYECFETMRRKLTDNRSSLLGELIKHLEILQSRTSGSMERVREIDKQIADLSAQNLVIVRLHTKGILDASAYTAQSAEIGNKISELRIERRRKMSEDEDAELIDELKALNDLLEDNESVMSYNEELMRQMVVSITVDDNASLTFKLLGGIELTEKINEKGRCKSA